MGDVTGVERLRDLAAAMLASYETRDLVFEGEPLHELVREIADQIEGEAGAPAARPDSWARWREDAGLTATEYADKRRVGRVGYEELNMYRDLVRRAEALCERGAE